MIKRFLQRRKHGLPRYKKDVWWNRSFHNSQRRFPIVKFEDYGYVNCEIGVVVPMADLGDGLFAYYQVTKITRQRGADWLYDSDNISCDMKFVFVKKGTGFSAPEKKEGIKFIAHNP